MPNDIASYGTLFLFEMIDIMQIVDSVYVLKSIDDKLVRLRFHKVGRAQ